LLAKKAPLEGIKTAMKKILVFVDSDVVIRHFIKSKTFDEIESKYQVVCGLNRGGETGSGFPARNSGLVRSGGVCADGE